MAPLTAVKALLDLKGLGIKPCVVQLQVNYNAFLDHLMLHCLGGQADDDSAPGLAAFDVLHLHFVIVQPPYLGYHDAGDDAPVGHAHLFDYCIICCQFLVCDTQCEGDCEA